MSEFCSNILYKQSFSTDTDIYVSFLVYDPRKPNLGDVLLLQTGDKLLLQNRRDRIVIQYNMFIGGLGVFLIDAAVPTLTGGGDSTGGYGAGMVTDLNTTSLSAISGMFMSSVMDFEGTFGQKDTIEQFSTGNDIPIVNSVSLRVGDTFDFKGSVYAPGIFSSPYNDDYLIFRVGFKNKMSEVIVYEYENGISYNVIGQFNTGIPAHEVPDRVK